MYFYNFLNDIIMLYNFLRLNAVCPHAAGGGECTAAVGIVAAAAAGSCPNLADTQISDLVLYKINSSEKK